MICSSTYKVTKSCSFFYFLITQTLLQMNRIFLLFCMATLTLAPPTIAQTNIVQIRLCPGANFTGNCITRISTEFACITNLQFSPLSAVPLSPTSLCTVYTSLNCGGNFVNININGNPSLNGLHRSVRCAIWIELYTQVIKIFIRNK